MTDSALIERITRSLAFMLRHQPETFDLELDAHGYADLEDVVQALNERLGEPVEEEDVRDAVSAGDRPRYEIIDDRIRALYGHSIPVEPGPSSKPPEFLYVAVPARELDRARRFGLRGGRRRFLHLAITPEDAAESGRRASRDYTVLLIHALDAWEEGISFFDRTALWLAEEVPTHLIEVEGTYHDGTEPVQRHDSREEGGREHERSDERGGGRARGRRGRGGRGRGRDGQREPARDGDRAPAPREGVPSEQGDARALGRDQRAQAATHETRDRPPEDSRRDGGRERGPERPVRDGREDRPAFSARESSSGGRERRDERPLERPVADRHRPSAERDVERRDERPPERRDGRREENRGDRGERRPARVDDHSRSGRPERVEETRSPQRERDSAPRSAAPTSSSEVPRGGFGAGIEHKEAHEREKPHAAPARPSAPPPRQERAPVKDDRPGFGAGL